MILFRPSVRFLLRNIPIRCRKMSSVNVDLLKPEVVLSEENRRAFTSRFKLYKTIRQRDQDVSQAAVLVPICIHNGELGLLFTLRSMKLSSNRGQVSFPGGMQDNTDKDLVETALRETWEELRIPKEKVDVWCSGNMLGKQKVNVMPVVGFIGEVDPNKLDVNKDEVEEAFVISLRKLCDPALCGYTKFRDSYTLPSYFGGKHRVWGFTGAITHMVLASLVPEVYKPNIPAIVPKKAQSKL